MSSLNCPFSVSYEIKKEALWMMSFFVRWYLVFAPVTGGFWNAVAIYAAAKILQGLWLSILTQSHHLHLGVSAQDKNKDWFSYQVRVIINIHANHDSPSTRLNTVLTSLPIGS